MWMFALFFAFVLLGVVILSAWIGPHPDRWEPEDWQLVEILQKAKQADSKAPLRPTDQAGLAHTDDLRP